ncbi:MAG TPA: hypothetical protein VNC78_03105 [Actinomycetota bacterium]|nr:hypothetical protein [Actinomycetota bacterium]
MPTKTMHCRRCERNVYLDAEEPSFCPVCSDPLFEVSTPTKQGSTVATARRVAPSSRIFGQDYYLG